MKNRWITPLLIALLVLVGCTVPQPPAAWMYVVTPTDLYQVRFPGGDAGEPDRLVGKILDAQGNRVVLLDIALDPADGQLYGVARNTLYRVDTATARVTSVGSGLGVLQPGAGDEVNALAFGGRGVLYAGSGTGLLIRVDPQTGLGTSLGSLGAGQSYSGDLASGPDGTLYATITGGDIYDELVRVNPQTGAATRVGPIGYRLVYGLQFVGGTLYGLTDGKVKSLISINPATGQGTLIRTVDFIGYGIQRER